MTSRKLIAFDFDGVIIDSEDCMKMAWESTRRIHGIEAEFSDYRRNIGKPFMEILICLGVAPYNEIQDTYIETCEKYSSLVKPYENALRIIGSLGSHSGVIVALVTSKPKRRTLSLVEKFELSFDHILCPEDTYRGKPHPDPLIKLNKLTGISSEESMFVGDMESDYQCARSASWEFIYTDFGYGGEIEAIACYDRIKSWIELEGSIDRWMKK